MIWQPMPIIFEEESFLHARPKPTVCPRETSVSSKATAVAAKAPYVFEMVKATVQNNFLFRHLEDEALIKLVERMREVRCEVGRIVCRQGDKGDYFYIVESGVYAVYKRGELVHTYRVNESQDKPSFGELALMYARPRAATVRCVEPGTLWGLDRSGFREAQKTALETAKKQRVEKA